MNSLDEEIVGLNDFADVLHVDNLKELSLISSSKGNQRKWLVPTSGQYVKEQFYFQGKYWEDWKVELLSGIIYSTMNTRVKVLEQKAVKLDCGTVAVLSDDFCKSDESFLSFNRILQRNAIDFNEKWFPLEKFEFIVETVLQKCEIDITEYLIVMAVIDYILLNEDRHLNNFGVIVSGSTYMEAPLFDFGLGLFEHDKKYQNKSYDKALMYINGKPFCEDMKSILQALARSKYKDLLYQVLPNIGYKEVATYAPNELGRKHLQVALEFISELRKCI